MTIEKSEEMKKKLGEIQAALAIQELNRKWEQQNESKISGRLKRDGDNRARSFHKNPETGKDEPWSAQLYALAGKAVNPGSNSMITWQTAMLELLQLFELVVKVAGPKMVAFRHDIGDKAQDIIYEPIRNRARSWWNNSPKVTLEPLVHNVTVDENNKLVISPLKSQRTGKAFDDGLPEITPAVNQLNALFKRGIDKWLKEQHGYTETAPNSGEYKNGAQTLTKETLERLKADPNKGLDKFLKEHHTGMNFIPAPPNPGQ